MNDIPEPEAAPPASEPPRAGGFDAIRNLGIARPEHERWIAGVAAGLARRWGVDPLLVRGGFVALTLLGGAGVLAYGLCWLLLPQEDGRIHLDEAFRGRVSAGFFAAAFLTVSSLIGGGSWWDQSGSPAPFFGLVAIAVLIWVLVNRRRDPANGSGSTSTGAAASGSVSVANSAPATSGAAEGHEPSASTETGQFVRVPTPARPRAPRVPARYVLAVLGMAVLSVAAIVAVQLSRHSVPSPWVVAPAVALGVLGLGVAGAGLAGRRGGWLTAFAILLLIGTVNASGFHAARGAGGHITWRPLTAAQAAQGLDSSAGDTVIDLTDPGLMTGLAGASGAGGTAGAAVKVPINQGAGQVRVLLPRTVHHVVEANVGVGELIRVGGTDADQQSGLGLTTKFDVPGTATDPQLQVTVDLGVGSLRLEETP